MHASGTSGPFIVPRGDGAEEGIRQELLDRLLASRDDAIFLTAAKTDKGSDAWYDLIPTPDSEE